MSRPLTVSDTIKLGDELQAAAVEFAAREEKLRQELRSRTEAAQFRHKQELETHAARLETELAQARSEFEAAKAALNKRYEARTARIRSAYPSSRKHGLDRINNDEGRKKYPLQRGLLDTERNRVEGLKQNDAEWAAIQRELEESREALGQLEQSARSCLRGYRGFRRRLSRPPSVSDDVSGDERQLLEEMHSLQAQAAEHLGGFRRAVLPALLRLLPIEFWVAGSAMVALVPCLKYFGIAVPAAQTWTPVGAGLLASTLVVYYVSKSRWRPRARALTLALHKARRLHDVCLAKAEARHAAEGRRIVADAEHQTELLQLEWRLTIENAAMAREFWPQKLDEKWRRISKRHDQLHEARANRLRTEHAARVERLKEEAKAQEQRFSEAHRARLDRIKSDRETEFKKLEEERRLRIEPLKTVIQAANTDSEQRFPPWEQSSWAGWSPPTEFQTAARFGRLKYPSGNQSQPPVTLPLVLTYPVQGSVLFETRGPENEQVVGALNNIAFRLMATTPAGKAAFTIIDPVRLGENFASVMHLADYEENLINGRIWTQPNQIEEKLGEINEHIEKVIQMYLRNEYETVADYNRDAGNIAEKYHFLIVANFPANFTDAAARRLLRIAASGARCGVFVLIHWDHRHPLPPDFLADELRRASVCVSSRDGRFAVENSKAEVLLDPPPAPEFATWFLHKVGEASRGSSRVEVPFAHVAPDPNQVWTVGTAEEVRVPIGRAGATRLQYLALGRGTRQHVLIAGKTGSGKSTLFHAIITNLALWCSPQEVEFYLVDFKKGVEFKCYAASRLPHARVVAIESDREFGLSVLERVDEELRRRGDLFRKAGVQDLAAYRATAGAETMPRCLLIIDEFQELFVEDDRTAQAANVLLDRIVRQGRAFGIHVLLGSQTLGGAYTLARTTMGQMVVRIALQCNEADAYLIMDENNPAPRLLSRPGEGIHNDRSGMIEGNSPFQAVWLSEEERDVRLQAIRDRANQLEMTQSPIVFEGNAPADVTENELLRNTLRSKIHWDAPRIWLGLPNAIKGPTEAVFEGRAGSNLLIVGQREEAVLAMLSIGLVSLAAQHQDVAFRFIMLDGGPSSQHQRISLDKLSQQLPYNEFTLLRPGDSLGILHQLAEQAREDHPQQKTFLILHRLQNFKKLRAEDDLGLSLDGNDGQNPAADLQTLINEGPARGLHVLASIDTYNNVTRWLGRKTLSEFNMRVLFQMSASDSASLCDDPKASALGLHRALFVNEQQGYLETFRPYALPPSDWFESAVQKLASARLPVT